MSFYQNHQSLYINHCKGDPILLLCFMFMRWWFFERMLTFRIEESTRLSGKNWKFAWFFVADCHGRHVCVIVLWIVSLWCLCGGGQWMALLVCKKAVLREREILVEKKEKIYYFLINTKFWLAGCKNDVLGERSPKNFS
jgi:hypothetical protein